MNDVLYPYLKFDQDNPVIVADVNACIKRMDDILLKYGWEYTGFHNMYRPAKGTDREETWHKAQEAVIHDERIKKYDPYFMVGTLTNACELEGIKIDAMSPINKSKLQKYRGYFEKEKCFAHGIVVDEHNQLRDGYATYLIAKEVGANPDIMRVEKSQVFRKVVCGRHITWKKDHYTEGGKTYSWFYSIKDAVIPGDILCVRTKNGGSLIKTERIYYVAGSYVCNRHKNVLCHTGSNWNDFQKLSSLT